MHIHTREVTLIPYSFSTGERETDREHSYSNTNGGIFNAIMTVTGQECNKDIAVRQTAWCRTAGF